MKKYKLEDLFYTQWHELSAERMADVVALNDKAKETLTAGDYKKWAYYVIAILRRLRRRPRLVDKLVEEQVADIFNAIKILHEPFYQFRVSRFELRDMSFIAPDEKMHNKTWDHFMYADKEFSLYLITENEKHINNLIAILYFPGKLCNENAIEFAPQIAKKLNDSEKRLIILTYANIRKLIFSRCKYLFGDSPSEDAPKPTGAIWLKWKHYLAETPAFQGFDNAGKAPLYSALDYLNDLAERKANQKQSA